MKLRYLSVSCLLLAASIAHGRDLANQDVYHKVKPVPSTKAQFAQLEGRVASMDDQRGVPTFIWAHRTSAKVSPHQTPAGAAEWYLGRFAKAYRLSKGSVGTAYVSHIHDTGRGGIIVSFRQRVDGVEVVNNRLNVLMTRDYRLVAITGNLHEAAVPQNHVFKRSPASAMAVALSDISGGVISAQGIVDTQERRVGYGYYEVDASSGLAATGLQLSGPARVKPVLYPMPDRLVPAYHVEMFVQEIGSTSARAYGHYVGADDGAMLMRRNLTVSDSFDYRVWAETDGFRTPLDGPQEEYTPHPTSMPDGLQPDYVPSTIISMEGFNTNPGGSADPWLPSGANVTTGNNIDAYADLNAPDGFGGGDLRADTTSANTFDYTYDPLVAPDVSPEQIKASVTQLFYTNNWLHDYFYDSGFNESAGNAQEDNYGRGGADGDVLHAQAQDYSGTNNANMSTPGDGSSPRMQMYVWNGAGGSTVEALNTTFSNNTASFGPQTFSVTGNIVPVSDGTGTDTDGCETIQNNLTGDIALIDRGNCTFISKVANAEAAGAVGVIIANNQPGQGPPGMGGGPPPNVNIGVLSVSFEDGQLLHNAYANNPPVPGFIERQDVPDRDGTIDNGIVSHEWGHYIHHRLVNCGSNQCGGQSEGWGDFIALMTIVREGDDYNGVYAVAGYSTAVLGDAPYFGIRRVPYSSDFTYNAFTFRHIMNGEALPDTHPMNGNGNQNAQVHNSGEIWATMLFQGYTALLGQTTGQNPTLTFDEAKRHMADYIVGGLILAPANPTYTEQLQSILAAAAAQNQTDYLLLAQAFADRGADSCAVSPTRFSTNHAGVVEDFNLRGEVQIDAIVVDDDGDSCDGDGVLDANETGHVRVTITNTGDAELLATEVEVVSNNANVTFPQGSTITVASIMPQTTTVATVEVAVSNAVAGDETVQFDITATNNDACETIKTGNTSHRMQYDIAQTTSDDVESPATGWTEGGTLAGTWARGEDQDGAGNNVWYGIDNGSLTDTYIQSLPMDLSATENFVLSFDHRYSFERDAQTLWDGSVIEVSTDGGMNWNDVDMYVDPGYDGVITDLAGNPLSDRDAYSGTSPSWPGFNNVSLDFGTQLAGESILVRFRIGTDQAVGDFGWELDNFSVSGTDNAPFLSNAPEDGICNEAPTADAGPDQTVDSGASVTLDGSGSSDPEGDPLTFLWTQVAGPTVTLTGDDTDAPTFDAPVVMDDTVLTFSLTVDDTVNSDMDMVDITVRAELVGGPDGGVGPDGGGDPGDPDGGCCQTSAQPSAGNLVLGVLVMFGIAIVTRRRRRDDIV